MFDDLRYFVMVDLYFVFLCIGIVDQIGIIVNLWFFIGQDYMIIFCCYYIIVVVFGYCKS